MKIFIVAFFSFAVGLSVGAQSILFANRSTEAKWEAISHTQQDVLDKSLANAKEATDELEVCMAAQKPAAPSATTAGGYFAEYTIVSEPPISAALYRTLAVIRAALRIKGIDVPFPGNAPEPRIVIPARVTPMVVAPHGKPAPQATYVQIDAAGHRAGPFPVGAFLPARGAH